MGDWLLLLLHMVNAAHMQVLHQDFNVGASIAYLKQ